jgi:hypothetical protein
MGLTPPLQANAAAADVKKSLLDCISVVFSRGYAVISELFLMGLPDQLGSELNLS